MIPPWTTGDFGMGRTASDLCSLRIRGVFAGASVNTADDGGAGCYASALSAVNSYDFDDVPWGQVYFMDYGTGLTSCSHTDSLQTLDYVGISFSNLTSYASFDGPRTPYSFEILKLQLILPPTWNIQAWSGEFITGPGRCVANDSLTADATDPDHPDMAFAPAGSRLITLPVPSWGLGTYWLFPCDHCSPVS